MKTVRLSEYIRQYIAGCRKSTGYKRAGRNTAKHIENFEAFLGKSLNTNDFNESIMEEFDYFLRNHSKGYLRSYIKSLGAKTIAFLGKVRKAGYEVDLSAWEYRFPEGEYNAVALTEEEVEAIFYLKNLSPAQENVRFWFVFNCCTAFRFSDLKRVESVNFVQNRILLRTKKTNESVDIPIHWMIRELLAKTNGKLPPLTSQQNYGEIVKRLCLRAKIKDEVLIERHEGTRFVRKSVPKWQLVSAHTARRSFATNAYLAGIKVARIMLMTGHKTQAAFFRYIRIQKSENATYLSTHEFFAGYGKIATFAKKEVVKRSEKKRIKVASILQTARIQQGLSVQDVADRVGCKPATVERIEKGLFSPSSEVLFAFCDALDISLVINNETV